MEVELIKVAANLGLAAVIAVILMLWKRQDDKRFEAILEGFLARQEEVVKRVVQVIEANNRALTDVNAALGEIRAFMDRVDQRLARLEEKINASHTSTFR